MPRSPINFRTCTARAFFTGGVNYYVNAYKHRIQLNYCNVDERLNADQHPGFRGVKNNLYVLSYQVQF